MRKTNSASSDDGEDPQHHVQAGAGGGQDVALEQADDLRVAVRVGGEEEDRGRGREGVGGADARLDALAPVALEQGEDERRRQREDQRADQAEHALADLELLVRTDEQPVDEEREGDARRRHLRQRDAEEDHAAQDEVDADQRAHDTDEHAADQRVAQEKVGGENRRQRAHSPLARGGPHRVGGLAPGAAVGERRAVRPARRRPTTTERTADRMRPR